MKRPRTERDKEILLSDLYIAAQAVLIAEERGTIEEVSAALKQLREAAKACER
jgi:hypothetical protein